MSSNNAILPETANDNFAVAIPVEDPPVIYISEPDIDILEAEVIGTQSTLEHINQQMNWIDNLLEEGQRSDLSIFESIRILKQIDVPLHAVFDSISHQIDLLEHYDDISMIEGLDAMMTRVNKTRQCFIQAHQKMEEKNRTLEEEARQGAEALNQYYKGLFSASSNSSSSRPPTNVMIMTEDEQVMETIPGFSR